MMRHAHTNPPPTHPTRCCGLLGLWFDTDATSCVRPRLSLVLLMMELFSSQPSGNPLRWCERDTRGRVEWHQTKVTTCRMSLVCRPQLIYPPTRSATASNGGSGRGLDAMPRRPDSPQSIPGLPQLTWFPIWTEEQPSQEGNGALRRHP